MLRALGVPDRHLDGSDEDKNEPLEMLGGRSARYAMQTLGTEWGRHLIAPNIWADAARQHYNGRIDAGERIVFDDVRFENECLAIMELGGLLVEIVRPNITYVRDAHPSEQLDFEAPITLANTGLEGALRENLVKEWRKL
jgi:hypothetical protein